MFHTKQNARGSAFLLHLSKFFIMAKGRNPLKYSEIFDLSDKSVVNQILNDLKAIDKQYNQLATSIERQSQVMKDSFVRSVEQMIATSQRLNLSYAASREQLRDLATATDQLRERQKAQKDNEAAGKKVTKDAADSINALKKEITALTKEYSSLSKSDEASATRMKEISARVQQLKKDQKSLSDELKLTKTTVDAVTGSYLALEKETKSLTQQLKAMPNAFSATNKEAQALIKQINENNTKLKDFDKSLNIHNRNVGNYADTLKGAGSGLKSFALAMAGAFIGFQSLQQGAQLIIHSNIEISDSLADVRRTAQLTREEGDKLVESLKQLDTRTSLKGLLDLATIGGQLGVPKEELVGFVRAIDQLAVSLKGELAGGAEQIAQALGKVNAVFKIASTEGVNTEQAMLKTGSAILKLGQAGLATGDFLADFAQRVGGVGANAGISLPQILAYGATLEELGISAEVSGTAMNQLINLLAKTPEKFFKVASIGDATLKLKDFTNLINTDTAKALDVFFKGLNAGGGTLTQFSTLVASLGLKGTRSINVVSALAKNTELLELRTRQANSAFQEGTLASEQFQIKNQSLAAGFEKLANSITNTFANAPFFQGLSTLINRMTDGETEGDRLSQSFKEQKAAIGELDSSLPPLLSQYDRLIKKSEDVGGQDKLTKEEQDQLNRVMNEIGKILPTAISQMDQFGNVTGIARQQITGLTDAMRENLRLAGQSAATALREENKQRERKIALLQEEIKTGAVGRTVERANTLGVGLLVNPAESQEVIAQTALKQADAIKKLKDVLLQELSPAEQKVYDQFYGNQKRSLTAAEQQAARAAEVAAAEKKATEAAAAAGINLDEFGQKGKRAKTEIEKLEKQVRLLEYAVKSQAITGKVSKDTLDALAAASNKLRDAQDAGNLAIQRAVEPYKALQTEVSLLTNQLQNEVAAGMDTTNTTERLTAASDQLELAQNAVKLAISGTISEQERLNTQLELTRKELERQAAQGNITNSTLNAYAQLTLKVRDNSEAFQLAVMRITDPMGALNLQAEQLKRTLTEQAVAGSLSAEELEKYRAVLILIAQAQQRLQAAMTFNPLDPRGRQQAADRALQRNQRSINAISPLAEAGDRGFLDSQRELEQERLSIMMESLSAQQAALVQGSKEWEDIETQKTEVLAQQERLRNQISADATRFRAELITEGLQLLQTGLNGFFELQKSQQAAQLQQLETDKARELEIAGNNTAAKEAIEAKYARKQAEIKRKQAQQEKTQALFQIAIETAIGAARAIASSPVTFGMPWLAFVLAQGVLQAALVAARPIPQFYKGTENAPAGVAWVGERGPEAIKKKDGSVHITEGTAHLRHLDAGDKVYTAHSPETKYYQRLLSGKNNINDAGSMYVDSSGRIMDNRAGHETRIMADAMKSLGNVLQTTQGKSSHDSSKVVEAVKDGTRIVAETIKKNRTIIRSQKMNYSEIGRIADYINYNMKK